MAPECLTSTRHSPRCLGHVSELYLSRESCPDGHSLPSFVIFLQPNLLPCLLFSLNSLFRFTFLPSPPPPFIPQKRSSSLHRPPDHQCRVPPPLGCVSIFTPILEHTLLCSFWSASICVCQPQTITSQRTGAMFTPCVPLEFAQRCSAFKM